MFSFVRSFFVRLMLTARGLAAVAARSFALGTRILGIGLAASGIAHFVAPRPFVAISKPIFPEDTDKAVLVNGSAETAIGLALIDRRSRIAGTIGLIAYGVYLGDRVADYAGKRLKSGAR